MVIKNSDGSEYFFTRPNPLLVNQNLWPDDEKITLEGTFSQKIIISATSQENKIVEDMEEIEEEGIKIVQSIIKKQEDEIIQRKDGVIDVWCLPALNQVDDLYNETHTRFGDKFSIKGKVWESQDLYIQLVTKQILTSGTIIFPQNGERRWWSVVNTNKMQDEGFYLVLAEITNYQPSFSD
jgi:hypothetical protein